MINRINLSFVHHLVIRQGSPCNAFIFVLLFSAINSAVSACSAFCIGTVESNGSIRTQVDSGSFSSEVVGDSWTSHIYKIWNLKFEISLFEGRSRLGFNMSAKYLRSASNRIIGGLLWGAWTKLKNKIRWRADKICRILNYTRDLPALFIQLLLQGSCHHQYCPSTAGLSLIHTFYSIELRLILLALWKSGTTWPRNCPRAQQKSGILAWQGKYFD